MAPMAPTAAETQACFRRANIVCVPHAEALVPDRTLAARLAGIMRGALPLRQGLQRTQTRDFPVVLAYKPGIFRHQSVPLRESISQERYPWKSGVCSPASA